MESRSVEIIVRVLSDPQIQYSIVSGLASVAHAYFRFTADVDQILPFDQAPQ
jgi:hypothetical protein